MAVANVGLDRATNTPVVILREDGGDRTLQIWIGAPEASAIALELRGERPERPMTHDLLAQILTGLGATLERASIVGVRSNTYYAELLVRRADRHFEVDARPSDSIALALRAQAPIYVEPDLLNGAGPRDESPPPEGGDPEALRRFLSRLDPEDLGRFHP